MGNKDEEKTNKNNLFESITSGISNAANAVGKGAKEVGKVAGVVAGGIASTAKKAVEVGSDIVEKQRIKSKNSEIDAQIAEHKYNIGKYIYDNELEIDDGVIISTINTIDRLVDEITKLEGNNNG